MPHSSGEPVEISGQQYWYYHAFSGAKDSTEEDGKITGEIRTKHGPQRFVADARDVASPVARTKGYISAVESFLSLLEYGETERKRSAGENGLKRLTGLNFKTATEWNRWLNQNRSSLRYSEASNRLVVEKQ